MKIILASKSPRRKEILSDLHVKFDIIVPDIDESSDITDPASLVRFLSEKKGLAVADMLPKDRHGEDTLIISSDTVVALDGVIFGKPRDLDDAKRMVLSLAGRTHSVFSGISLILIKNGITKVSSDFECTYVTFDPMSENEVDLYLTMENVLDKAGAYAIQGAASLWIDRIEGNYFNVVGLPVNKLTKLAAGLGIPISSLTDQKSNLS